MRIRLRIVLVGAGMAVAATLGGGFGHRAHHNLFDALAGVLVVAGIFWRDWSRW